MKKHDAHSKLVYVSFLWQVIFFLIPLLCSDISKNLYNTDCNEDRTWERYILEGQIEEYYYINFIHFLSFQVKA